MKFKIISSLVLLFIAVESNAQEQEKTNFSLQDCIDYALVNNTEIINAGYEKEIAETQVGETVSEGLPQVNATANLNYNFEPQKQFFDASVFASDNAPAPAESEEEIISFARKYDGNIGVSVKQLIFDGSFFVGLQAAKTYKELSTKDHIQTQIDVVEAVSKAYYNALVTKERYELLTVNLKRIDSLLNDTQVMYENGFAEKIEVSRLKVQQNNLKVEFNNTHEMLELSDDMLKFQMGMPISKFIKLTDDLNEVKFESLPTDDFDYSNRIEYSQLQTNKTLSDLDLKNNKVKYLPTLYANFNYGYNTQTDDANQWFKSERWLSNGLVGATLSVPIFDGFLKSNKIQKNKLQIKQLEQSFDQLENSIDLDIKKTKSNMAIALEDMAAQSENMELAEEIYNVSVIKYQEGVGSNLEVVEADADYKEAQTNYYNALYNALVAKVELEKAYGTLLDK